MNDSSHSFRGRFRRLLQRSREDRVSAPHSGLLVEDLEPRVLYSASPLDQPAPPPATGMDTIQVAQPGPAVDLSPPLSLDWASPSAILDPAAIQSSVRSSVADPGWIVSSSFQPGSLAPGQIATLEGSRVIYHFAAIASETGDSSPWELPVILTHEDAHFVDSPSLNSPLTALWATVTPS